MMKKGGFAMILDLNVYLILDGTEARKNENYFEIVLKGYKLYPVDHPIDVKKEKSDLVNGQVVIKEIKWKNEQTTIIYELKSLKSVN